MTNVQANGRKSTKQRATTIAARNAKEKEVKFQISAAPGSCVHIAGSFNNWDPDQNPLIEKKGVYATKLKLPVGTHEYKFIVDGNWCVDSQCEEWVSNGLGSINSVVTIK